MKNLIEEYVLGLLSPEEEIDFEAAMTKDTMLRTEVTSYRETMEALVWEGQVAPSPSLKTKIFAEIGKIAEEKVLTPPLLHPGSKAEDYAVWLDQEGMEPPEEFESLHFIPIAQTEDGLSAIVWIKDMVPEEVHTDNIERFLVLEGSCEISFGGEVYALNPGDYLAVPLHHPHNVRVTSDIVCKLIVQRHAA